MIGKRTVQTIAGWILIVGHFLIILYVLVAINGWNSSIKEGVILTLCPVTLVYVVTIVKTWITGQSETGAGVLVNINFAIIAIVVPLILLTFLAYTIYTFPSDFIADFSALQKWLSLTEVMFGGTVGLLIGDLFPAPTR